MVLLRHTDAKWNEDLSDLPKACEGERAQLPNTEAVRERIAEIPTLLRLPSACDRALLAVAAQKLVAEHQAGMVEFLAGPQAWSERQPRRRRPSSHSASSSASRRASCAAVFQAFMRAGGSLP